MARRASRLAEYNRKRDFKVTREPPGEAPKRSQGKLGFLVQKHDARRLHYDLRLEWEGVLKSWAVTKGPSLDPAQKRLAVRTEDHPLDYGDFEGSIPQGQYGGGTVMLWDRGTWEPLGDPEQGLQQGKLHFRVHGERMQGGWALIRLRGKQNEKRENWLLIKDRDEFAGKSADALAKRHLRSVKSGRSMDEIARDAPAGKTTSTTPVLRSKPTGKLPAFQNPQLATLVTAAPAGEDWLHEIKFDGYRCLAAVGGGKVRCYSRSGLDWTGKFRPVADVLQQLECASALIDGEIVAGGGAPGSQFSALQKALKESGELQYYAFDLLSLNGKDLRRESLVARKERLEALLASLPEASIVHYSEHVRGSGPKVYESICKAGQEGIISKRADSIYQGRRTKNWLKIKCTKRQEFVIGGYSPSDKKGRPLSSLLLGTYENNVLQYRGRVGSGFSGKVLDEIYAKLQPLGRESSPFAQVPASIARTAHWVKPRVVVEVDFTEFTADGNVRHGVFLGVREDKEAKTVELETAGAAPANDDNVDLHGIRLSNPERVLYPQQGVSKRDLARYYDAVAERMLPLLSDRPLSLVRCPKGADTKCFFQKHASAGFPAALKTVPISEKSGGTSDYMYLNSVEGLIAGVQMGVLEFHIWGSRRDNIEKPDRLIFDLDPDEGLAFAEVRQAAFDLRDKLASFDLHSVAMVTGGKGIHVIVPLRRHAEWPALKAVAKAFAGHVAEEEPERFIATMSKAKRRGKIFIDWLRNERGSTAIAPYSTRARLGAPVATPVSWEELRKLDAANAFGIEDVIARLVQPDPWRDSYAWKQTLSKRFLDALAG